MKIFGLPSSILQHPLDAGRKLHAVIRLIRWQIGTAFLPYQVLYPFVGDIPSVSEKGPIAATSNIWCGLFVLHFRRVGDLFYDIGANIAAYTLLASGVCKARSLTYEPTKSTFKILELNIRLNDLEESTTLINEGVGSKRASVALLATVDSEQNRVATPEDKDTVSIPMRRIDDDTTKYGLPLLAKIDVEGYEANVLQGMERTQLNPQLKTLIIELNGSTGRFGIDQESIHRSLISAGFNSYAYNPLLKEIVRLPSFGKHNTRYIRDVDFGSERLKSGNEITVLGKVF